MSQNIKDLDSQKWLLIVDDNMAICGLLMRTMMSGFNSVFTATSPDQAERILSTRLITHLMCDNNLGPNFPKGLELIPVWREKFAYIQWAALFTGELLDNPIKLDGIDVVLKKSTDLNNILQNVL